MNQTMEKFGHPATLVRDLSHWCVLLRSQQATLGALVLVCKEDVEAFSQISQEAFAELADGDPSDRNISSGVSAL